MKNRFRRASRASASVALAAAFLLSALAGTAKAQFDTPCLQGTTQQWPEAGHVLRNLAYGPTPALITDLANPGTGKTLDQWIQEQLAPSTVPEVHPELVGAVPNLYGITLPDTQGALTTMEDLVHHQLIRATYSERQLQERLVWCWEQNFTTNYSTVEQYLGDDLTALWLEHIENEEFRAKALGRFKHLLRASATSPTMLIYLDSVKNQVTASGQGSNENYARELLELHTTGQPEDALDPVSGLLIYDANDVAVAARVFTGWTIAPKLPQDFGNPGARPLTNCESTAFLNLGDVDMNGIVNQADVDEMIAEIAAGTNRQRFDIEPAGMGVCPNFMWGGNGVVDNADLMALLANVGQQGWMWSFHFDTSKHDYTPKVLFDHNNPKLPRLQMPLFPVPMGGGPGSPAAVKEGYILLDHLARSPYTAQHIATKFYEIFLADLVGTQAPAVIDDMVATWNATGGRIDQVLPVLFDLSRDFGQQSHYFDKVRMQMEAVVAPVRAFEGDHPTSLAPINRMRLWLESELGYFWFRYPSPEGFEEKGDQHVSTWKMLQWTRYNQHVWEPGSVPSGSPFPNFQYDITGILTANGVDRNNAAAVVNFFSRLLYQCNFSMQDHQLCVEFLTTDELGVPLVLSSLNSGQYEEQIRRFAAFIHSLPQGIEQ